MTKFKYPDQRDLRFERRQDAELMRAIFAEEVRIGDTIASAVMIIVGLIAILVLVS
jgi:hypothetical protein